MTGPSGSIDAGSGRTSTSSGLTTGSGPRRVVRAGVFALSSAVLAVVAHRLAGGMPPAPGQVAAAAALLFGFGLFWARCERGGSAITAVVLISQLALHAAFAEVPMKASDKGHAGPMHMAGAFTDRGVAMLAVHLGAALVMAWWLRRGERAVWSAVGRVVRDVAAASRARCCLVSSRPAGRVTAVVWAPRRWMRGTGVVARGPPAGCVPACTA